MNSDEASGSSYYHCYFCSKVVPQLLSFLSLGPLSCMSLSVFLYYGCRKASICHILCIFCRPCLLQVFISHPPTPNHPSLDLWAPPDQLLFPTKLLTPTYQSHVSAVITCVCPNLHLLIPFPNPGLGYRAAEKPDPLLSSPLPPLAISPSLSLITGLCRSCNWKVKWTQQKHFCLTS